MILSSDELGIVEYLKSWKGTSVSMVEISRSAGGRQKFRESPNWANGLMSRLVEAGLVAVNDRGHYRFTGEEEPKVIEKLILTDHPTPTPVRPGAVVGEDYFPSQGQQATESEPENETGFWISPQLEQILKKAGKNFGR